MRTKLTDTIPSTSSFAIILIPLSADSDPAIAVDTDATLMVEPTLFQAFCLHIVSL